MSDGTLQAQCSQRGDPSCAPEEVRQKGFEPHDVPANKIGGVLAGLLGTVVLVLLGVGGMVTVARHWSEPPPASGFAHERVIPPAPWLEADPRADRLKREQPAAAVLANGQGRDQQPIAAAMKQIARGGWHDAARPPTPVETARAHTEARN